MSRSKVKVKINEKKLKRFLIESIKDNDTFDLLEQQGFKVDRNKPLDRSNSKGIIVPLLNDEE